MQKLTKLGKICKCASYFRKKGFDKSHSLRLAWAVFRHVGVDATPEAWAKGFKSFCRQELYNQIKGRIRPSKADFKFK
jgi:hypothetical protein